MKDTTTSPRTLEAFLLYVGIPETEDEAVTALAAMAKALRAARTDAQMLAEVMDSAEQTDPGAGFMGEVAQLVAHAFRLGYTEAKAEDFRTIRQKAAEFTQI